MLTLEDIQKLTEYQKTIFVTKEDLKSEIGRLENKIDLLTNAVDSFAKESHKNSQEITVINERLTKVKQKVGILPTK